MNYGAHSLSIALPWASIHVSTNVSGTTGCLVAVGQRYGYPGEEVAAWEANLPRYSRENIEAFVKAKGYELEHAGPNRYYLYELKKFTVPSGATVRRSAQNPKTGLGTFTSLRDVHAFLSRRP